MSTTVSPLNTESMPIWDLSDLYLSMDDSKLEADFKSLEHQVKKFKQDYNGKLASLTADEMLESILSYENMDDVMGRIISYAGLLNASDMLDSDISTFHQNTNERMNKISSHALFYKLEINELEDDFLTSAFSENSQLARYKPWFHNIRLGRPHQLDHKTEELLHEKSVTGRSAWNRLFDETMADLKFDFKNPLTGETESLGTEKTLTLMSDSDEKIRKPAAEALSATFEKNIRLFTLITNTLAKDKEIEDRLRNFEEPSSSRHLANQVEKPVVDALVTAVKASYPNLSHRYYKLKANLFGKETLNWWDRNAPLPSSSQKQYSWQEAETTVLKAYHDFSPTLGKIGEKFFGNGWIDAPVRDGKSPGAFAHPTVPSAHPYLLLNYLGKSRDVMTLAHELGHGIHQILAAEQGALLSDTPLTLAETASVFGEMLTFRSLLKSESDPLKRKMMIAGKVEDMLNTVVRQIAFYDFECQVHEARKTGEISTEKLSDIWMKVQKESLGDAITLDDNYRNFWCYIPHFIHAPFYVYAYAFGDCLVNSLYATYLKSPDGFEEKYIQMLKAGGSLRHKELLEPFGLDATDPSFWSNGLEMISEFIDMLED